VNPDPSTLSAGDLLAKYDRLVRHYWHEDCRRGRGLDWLLTPEYRALRAELLRRLAVYDRQRCGPPDPA
jgi:hypothetical protein